MKTQEKGNFYIQYYSRHGQWTDDGLNGEPFIYLNAAIRCVNDYAQENESLYRVMDHADCQIYVTHDYTPTNKKTGVI